MTSSTLKIYQNTAFSHNFTWQDETKTPVNLSNTVITMRIGALPDVLYTLSTENGRITIDDPTTGVFNAQLPPVITATIPAGVYHYDIIVEQPNNHTIKLLNGALVVEEAFKD